MNDKNIERTAETQRLADNLWQRLEADEDLEEHPEVESLTQAMDICQEIMYKALEDQIPDHITQLGEECDELWEKREELSEKIISSNADIASKTALESRVLDEIKEAYTIVSKDSEVRQAEREAFKIEQEIKGMKGEAVILDPEAKEVLESIDVAWREMINCLGDENPRVNFMAIIRADVIDQAIAYLSTAISSGVEIEKIEHALDDMRDDLQKAGHLSGDWPAFGRLDSLLTKQLPKAFKRASRRLINDPKLAGLEDNLIQAKLKIVNTLMEQKGGFLSLEEKLLLIRQQLEALKTQALEDDRIRFLTEEIQRLEGEYEQACNTYILSSDDLEQESLLFSDYDRLCDELLALYNRLKGSNYVPLEIIASASLKEPVQAWQNMGSAEKKILKNYHPIVANRLERLSDPQADPDPHDLEV